MLFIVKKSIPYSPPPSSSLCSLPWAHPNLFAPFLTPLKVVWLLASQLACAIIEESSIFFGLLYFHTLREPAEEGQLLHLTYAQIGHR